MPIMAVTFFLAIVKLGIAMVEVLKRFKVSIMALDRMNMNA